MARRGGGPGIGQLDMLAYVAFYGSERKAATALGISRGTVNDVARGRYEGGSKTVGAIAAATGEAVQTTVKAISGLIRSLTGGDTSQTAATGRRLAADERKAPGTVQESAAQYQQRMAAQGLRPDGTSLPPPADIPDGLTERPETDSLGRPITDEQWANYQELQAAYDAGTLNRDQYERFVGYQLGSGDGGTGVPIAPLFD